MPLALLLHRHAIAHTDRKVIKAEAYAQTINAQEYLHHIKLEAERIQRTVDDEVSQARKKGYEEGVSLGKHEVAQQMIQTVMRLESAQIGLEARLINTVMQALRSILGTLDESALMRNLILQSIRGTRHPKVLTLRVCTEQFDLVNEILEDILQDHPHIDMVDVYKDPQLALHSCVLESEYGALDGSLDQYLLLIQQSLLEAFSKAPQPDSSSEFSARSTDMVESQPC